MSSKHSSSAQFIKRGLYDDLQSFAELEKRISALGAENTKIVGDAFEVFVEGYLATQQKLQADTVWLVGQLRLHELQIPLRIVPRTIKAYRLLFLLQWCLSTRLTASCPLYLTPYCDLIASDPHSLGKSKSNSDFRGIQSDMLHCVLQR